MSTLFCNSCGELILDASECVCGWRRTLIAAGATRWSASLGCPLGQAIFPVVAQDRFVLATKGGGVVGIEVSSGASAWTHPLGPGCCAYRLVTDAHLVFVAPYDIGTLPCGERRLLALEAASGVEHWSFPVPAHSLSAPALDGRMLYFTASDGLLYALDRIERKPLWTAPHTGWGPDAPAVGAGLVVAGGRTKELVAYEAASGAERWRFAAGEWFGHMPHVCDGLVLVLCWDGYLYALDAGDRRVVWKRRGERDTGFTAPPAVGKDLTLIGSKAHPRYAVLALRTSTGEQVWRCDTAAKVLVPPLIVDDMALVALSDGSLIALSIADGSLLWQAVPGGKLVASPQPAGSLLLLAARDGACYAVGWRTETQGRLVPELHLEQGLPEQAAIAYALRGDFGAAASIYEGLPNQSHAAARLYVQAGQPDRAAELWEQGGQLRRAAELYDQIGQHARAAALWEKLDEWERAIKGLIQSGRPAEAAVRLERLNKPEDAARLFEQAGELDQALRLRVQLHQWEEAARLALKTGNRQEAAAAFCQAGRLDEAAKLFEEARLLGAALQLRERLGHWEEVARLAAALGDHERAAAVLLQIGRPRAAAAVCQRAAKQLAAVTSTELRAAELYEQAARIYLERHDEQQAECCLQEARRLRRLPKLTMLHQAQAVFVACERKALRLRLENSGNGAARMIAIDVSGPVDVQQMRPIAELAPGQTLEYLLSIRPHADELGELLLDLIVHYQDQYGSQHQLPQVVLISVKHPAATPAFGTPIATTAEYAPVIQSADTSSLWQRLNIYRGNLQDLLLREAFYGVGRATTELRNEIQMTRDAIKRVKHTLCSAGLSVIDHADDERNVELSMPQ